MRRLLKNYSLIEVLLVIIIVGLVALIGVYIWKAKHLNVFNPGPDPTTSRATISKVNDPYAGWKTYCDSVTNGCFMYPPDWRDVGPLQSSALRVFGQNPGGTLSLEYSEPVTGRDGLGDFYTNSIDVVSAARNPALKVIGGYYTVSNMPGYYLVDLSLMQQLHLSRGQISSVDSKTGLYFSKGTTKAEFTVHPNNTGGSATMPETQTNAWSDSPDGKLAEKIVQSFYFK